MTCAIPASYRTTAVSLLAKEVIAFQVEEVQRAMKCCAAESEGCYGEQEERFHLDGRLGAERSSGGLKKQGSWNRKEPKGRNEKKSRELFNS